MGGVCSKTNDDYDRPQVSLMDIQNLLNWVEVTEKLRNLCCIILTHLFLYNVDAVKVIK